MNYLLEFKDLMSNNKISISKIEWWLLKYSAIYKETHDLFYSKYWFELDDETFIRVPPCGKPTLKEKFLELYSALDTISDFHRNENYFKQEMNEYNKIKHSHQDLKIWITKNENLGVEKYSCFLLDYLDYVENNDDGDLQVFIYSLKEIEIYIDRKYFKNTIDFLETFNELFWD